MVDVVLVNKTETVSWDGDWDTAVDYSAIESKHMHLELEVEGFPILVTITHEWTQESYYLENEETGGYGPGMEYGQREYCGMSASIEWVDLISNDFSHPDNIDLIDVKNPVCSQFLKVLQTLNKGVESHVIIPMVFYRIIVKARLNENLEKIFTKNIPGYDRYADYRCHR